MVVSSLLLCQGFCIDIMPGKDMEVWERVPIRDAWGTLEPHFAARMGGFPHFVVFADKVNAEALASCFVGFTF